VTNPAFLLAVLGILVTAAVLYLTWDYIGCVPGKCLPSLGLPGLLVAGWIVVPPAFFSSSCIFAMAARRIDRC
jgi:hypothetical protein